MAHFEIVIGLEVHAQLLTKGKIFCTAPVADGEPNTSVGAVSAGLPGSLPVLNRHAVELAVRAGFACHCDINLRSRFARKNYFYPDLPKGYQISQFDEPICGEGWLEIATDESGSKIRKVRIQRIHMEEDAGQLFHVASSTLVNLNRAGTPLIEVVGHPDLRSPVEAKNYLKTLHSLLVHTGVTDGNLEAGNFRCDANISIRPVGETKLGTRTEIKNVNSFRFVELALEYEIARQIAVVEGGGTIIQETRGWDAAAAKTFSMRTKEDADDYRYFPDPDLPPLVLDPEWVKQIRSELPELPDDKRRRLQETMGLSESEAKLLLEHRDWHVYIDELCALGLDAKLAASWVISDLVGELNHLSKSFSENPFKATRMAELLSLLQGKKISRRQSKELLIWWMKHPESSIVEHVKNENLVQVDDSAALEGWVKSVIGANPSQVASYLAGQEKIFAFLMGQVMKVSQGKAHPEKISDRLKKELEILKR
ncbi:MAG: Asp-tRNA(Asn)/Glu-tRNA(Gln) amidotransferase subunit GatB [Bdellovibrionota bacterium]